MEIKGISSLPVLDSGKINSQAKEKAQSFSGFLNEAINQVNQTQLHAEQMTNEYALGNDVQLHEVVLATEKAALALQLTIQIRNKAIEAYQELMRMQI